MQTSKTRTTFIKYICKIWLLNTDTLYVYDNVKVSKCNIYGRWCACIYTVCRNRHGTIGKETIHMTFFFYIMLRFRENQVIWSVIWRNFISHILSTFLSRMIVLWMLGHPIRRSSAFLHRNVVKPICKEASNTVFDLTILHYIATKCCRKNQSV